MKLTEALTLERIQEISLPSNYKYGEAIYRRGAVKVIAKEETRIEAWVGGLDGSVTEGGGSRRRTTLEVGGGELEWHCTGNPKSHQIFCKHCVALALSIIMSPWI